MCVATQPLRALRTRRHGPASGLQNDWLGLGRPPPPHRAVVGGGLRERVPFPNLQHYSQKGAFMKLTGDRNQCPTCSVLFNSTRAFEKHRVGVFGVNRRCLTPTEMLERGMARNSAGFWVGSPMNREVLARVTECA